MKASVIPHSVFWLGEAMYREMGKTSAAERLTPEYAMRLSSIKKGVANYVRIVTGREIPVYFNKGKQSFATADDRIIIAASDDPEKIDMNVGLALHEAAHLRLSKKTATKESIPLYPFLEVLKKDGALFISNALRSDMLRLNRPTDEVLKELKLVVNVLEDRRIDQWMYSAMPGYRPYYEALYNELWHAPAIDKALASPLTHRPLLKYYRLHIINLTNANAHPDYLPGLRDIWNLINLPSVDRFSNDPKWETWQDAAREYKNGIYSYNAEKMPELLRVAIKVVEIMYANAMRPDQVPDDDDVLEDMARDKMKASKPTKQKTKPDEEQDEEEQDMPDDADYDQDGDPADDESSDDNTDSDESSDDEDDSEGEGDVDDDADDVGDSSDDSEAEEGDPSEDEGDDEAVGTDEDDSDERSTDTDDGEGSEGDDQQDIDGTGTSKLPNTTDDEPVKKARRDFKEADLDKAMESQEKLLQGEVEKEAVDDSIANEIDAVESSGAELKSVGDTFKSKCVCIVYNKLTTELMRSAAFAFSTTNGTLPVACPESVAGMKDGEQLGNALAHRLRIMADESTLIYTRQQNGKLDKRLISGLGYGAENVFNHSLTERMEPVMMHLSIDASTSMEGVKWRNSIMLAVAMAKAAEKVRNLNVVITLRSGDMNHRAQIAVVYDSRVDRFVKVRNMFPFLRPNGGTPEGLTFEAIKEQFLDTTRGVRRFFVNISDGEPCFWWYDKTSRGTMERYEGEAAWTHTARQIKDFRNAGITVLSYFVSGPTKSSNWYNPSQNSGLSRDDYSKKAFTAMYGRDAAFIDVKNIMEIARTLNTMFLSS